MAKGWKRSATALALGVLLCALSAPADAAEWPGRKSQFHGFDMFQDGRNRVVVPKTIADGKPWIWRARFFGHRSEFDVAMLAKELSVSKSQIVGEPKRPKHQIVTDKIRALGMEFGGDALLRETVANLVEGVRN